MGQVVAITGASSGIGRALSFAWAKRGATLILHGRNPTALAEVASSVRDLGGIAHTEVGDITDAAARERFVTRIRHDAGHLDVLVNNAGRGYHASFEKIDLGQLEDLFRLNVVAPLALAQSLVQDLAWSKGTVVMMSSVTGTIAAPRFAAYAATKFALEAISMAMRAELASRGVNVVVVRPGPVNTPFRDHALRSDEGGYRTARLKSAETASHVAEQTIRAVLAKRPVVETTWFVKGTALLARAMPSLSRTVLIKMAQSPTR